MSFEQTKKKFGGIRGRGARKICTCSLFAGGVGVGRMCLGVVGARIHLLPLGPVIPKRLDLDAAAIGKTIREGQSASQPVGAVGFIAGAFSGGKIRMSPPCVKETIRQADVMRGMAMGCLRRASLVVVVVPVKVISGRIGPNGRGLEVIGEREGGAGGLRALWILGSVKGPG